VSNEEWVNVCNVLVAKYYLGFMAEIGSGYEDDSGMGT
jgi:hypothetical protein